mgnify:CR=1 FL=1
MELHIVVNWFQIMFLFLVRQRRRWCRCLYYVVNWFQIMFLFLVRQLFNYTQILIVSCELISNYVLIFGSTTFSTKRDTKDKLWIDFKLCSYFWFDNLYHWNRDAVSVVNWFQIMFLFLVRQQGLLPLVLFCSCELISNYVLIFGSTTGVLLLIIIILLWIDFKLCSYFWFDNCGRRGRKCHRVVNWFQIMFLFLVRQLIIKKGNHSLCCELISNYVLIFGSTTKNSFLAAIATLWIDFKLCSYFWFDNFSPLCPEQFIVVNWFQIMFLFLVRQLYVTAVNLLRSCELISNYVLIFGSTTKLPSFPPA